MSIKITILFSCQGLQNRFVSINSRQRPADIRQAATDITQAATEIRQGHTNIRQGHTGGFKVGDIVEIGVEASMLSPLQREHGGIRKNMIRHLCDVGRVFDILDDGDVMVKFGDKGPFIFNPDILTKVVLDEPIPTATSNVASTPTQQSTAPANEKPQCKICLSQEISVAIQPCGHAACCSDCIKRVNNCPICRGRIANLVRIFIP